MPMFEYRCESCSATFEKLVRSGAQEKVTCPSCGSGEVAKLFSSFATGASAHQHGSGGCPSGAGPGGG